MVSACIAIGAASYDDSDLAALPGAAVDAMSFYREATSVTYGCFDKESSKLLLNPTREQVRAAVSDATRNTRLNSLTIYFAGHGAETKSGYFLTCRDAICDRLALTGLSLTDVFQLLNDRSGSFHTNVIVDACQAGGIAADLSAITKSFEVGVAGGSSVSILAMSSRGEAAEEALDGSGGFGTKALLNIMTGAVDTGKNSSELTLADVAQAMDLQGTRQTPSFWSFNLQGASAFCKNAYALRFRSSEIYRAPNVLDDVPAELSQAHREQLWRCYLDLAEDLDARKLYSVFSDTIADEYYSISKPSIVSGLFVSFLHRSRLSPDLFSPITLAATFAVFSSENLRDDELTQYFINVLCDELDRALTEVSMHLEEDHLYLVRDGGISNFIALPQRISSLAAWALLATRLSEVTATTKNSSTDIARRLLAALEENYLSSFALVSENQASSIAVISALGTGFCDDWVEKFAGCLFNSFFECRGKVARANLPDKDSFKYFKHRLSEERPDFTNLCGRPSEALFALLMTYWRQGSLDIIKYNFTDLDGFAVGTFIPQSYANFAEVSIYSGVNIHAQIGHDLFTTAELSTFIENDLMKRISDASLEMSDLQGTCAVLAALIFPDRVPWHLLLDKWVAVPPGAS